MGWNPLEEDGEGIGAGWQSLDASGEDETLSQSGGVGWDPLEASSENEG